MRAIAATEDEKVFEVVFEGNVILRVNAAEADVISLQHDRGVK